MTPLETGDPGRTRMLFLGDDSLADGFRLIGFETYSNPSPDEVDQVLRELQRDREHAFVVVDERLMQAEIPTLEQVRAEGGRIVVIAVPPLAAPPKLSSDVSARLKAMFGTASMAR